MINRIFLKRRGQLSALILVVALAVLELMLSTRGARKTPADNNSISLNERSEKPENAVDVPAKNAEFPCAAYEVPDQAVCVPFFEPAR